jgi:hypothetical protein
MDKNELPDEFFCDNSADGEAGLKFDTMDGIRTSIL